MKNKSARRPASVVRSAAAALDSTAISDRAAAYYAFAHGGPADVTLDRSTREIAQHRCEYEYLNEVTLYGACLKAAALSVGVGPALKIDGPRLAFGETAPADQLAKCQYLETLWADWCKDVKLRRLLQLLPMELIYHGEIILRKVADGTTTEGFKYVAIRPERLGNPFACTQDECVYDGIRFDRPGDGASPICYYILKESVNPIHVTYEYEEVPACDIIHVFSPMLPQQHRGCPSVQSGLPRLAQLRQLIRATLDAAINAAKYSIFLHTDNQDLIEAFSGVTDADGQPAIKAYLGSGTGLYRQGMNDGVIFAPPGYSATVTDPKHPSSTFDTFKKVITADIGAGLGLGSGKINNDHSAYNFSSAKMDMQIDNTIIEMVQATLGDDVLDPIFEQWLDTVAEVDQIADEFLLRARVPERVRHEWLWPEPKSIDELKSAQADDIRLKNGSTTLRAIYSRERKDYADQIAQWEAERSRVGAAATIPTENPMAAVRPDGPQNGE